MSNFTYLQALAVTIQQMRFKSIEVFNEDNVSSATKTFQLYKLALDPEMTSATARLRLSTLSSGNIQPVGAFNRLMQRTIARLENLVFFLDPLRFSDDPLLVQQIAAVRSLIIGLYLSQHNIGDGASFHLRKGLRHHETIPAAWQGFCVAGLRQLLLHVALHGQRHNAHKYHTQLIATNDALHLETTLRGNHDVLYAQIFTGSVLSERMRQQWNELYNECNLALGQCSMPWFVESVARITCTTLQVTERYDELIVFLRKSLLPKRETVLQTAICHMALCNLFKAADYAMRARDLFAQGTRNWFLCSDLAVRALLLQGEAQLAAGILQETRSTPNALIHDTHLKVGRRLAEAYCISLETLMQLDGPRRGRPHQFIRDLLEEIRAGSLARHFFIASHIWLLIESTAQCRRLQYDETLTTLWRFIQRRKHMRYNSRFGVFIEFLYQHRATAPSRADLNAFRKRLGELPSTFSDSEIVRFEILGKLLVNSEQRTASSE